MIMTIDEKLKRIDILENRANEANKEVVKLKSEVFWDRNCEAYDKTIQEPLDWDKMYWPSRSSASASGERRNPRMMCIVCQRHIGLVAYWSGGSTRWNQETKFNSSIFAHQSCVPIHIQRR